jgi:hypothetical protein
VLMSGRLFLSGSSSGFRRLFFASKSFESQFFEPQFFES